MSYIVFIVTPLLGEHANFAMLANTNTWNAYNEWGGGSRYTNDYTQNTTISFERPNPLTSPYLIQDHHTSCELAVLKWIKAQGFRVDIYTDYDFHKGIYNLAQYRALIIACHPEYWTLTMLDHLENYISNGGRLFYLGGNGIFESIQFSDDGKSLIFLNGEKGRERKDFYFRNLNPPRPASHPWGGFSL